MRNNVLINYGIVTASALLFTMWAASYVGDLAGSFADEVSASISTE